MYMEEIWKDIEGYEGYQASNFGRIRSLDRYIVSKCRCGGFCNKYSKGKILKQAINNCGYLTVSLGRHRKYLAHRLVWEAFVGSIPDDMEINHINEVKTDNRIENLSLMTHKSNINWGTCNQRSGKKHRKPIMQVTKDGEEFFCWFSLKNASEELNINQPNLWKALNGRYQSAGGFKWRYA